MNLSDMHATIQIKGREVKLDPQDLPLMVGRKWNLNRAKGGSFYVVHWTTQGPVHLHRLIANPPIGMVVDHVNGDPLDNRRCNLRVCTPFQNSMNRRRYKTASSMFKGVTPRDGGWRAQISINGTIIVLGKFKTDVDAAKAYDSAALKHRGQFACLNFPISKAA